MIIFKEFKVEDWWKIDDAVEPFPPNQPLEALTRGISMTAVEDGEVMACGGIVINESETEGTIWCKVSEKCLVNSLSWARAMKEGAYLMMDTLGDLKISTYILGGFCRGDKLARFIGLKKSGESEIHNGNTYYKYMAVI